MKGVPTEYRFRGTTDRNRKREKASQTCQRRDTATRLSNPQIMDVFKNSCGLRGINGRPFCVRELLGGMRRVRGRRWD